MSGSAGSDPVKMMWGRNGQHDGAGVPGSASARDIGVGDRRRACPEGVVEAPPFPADALGAPPPVASDGRVRVGLAGAAAGRPGLPAVGGSAPQGDDVMGLEDRLRRVQGVADITVELGDAGLESIRVRIDEGTEESSVLDEIRRILVAYGLRSRKAEQPRIDGDASRSVGESEAPLRPRINVGPRGEGLYVRLTEGERIVERMGERSPLGVAQAMVEAVAAWRGVERPNRIALALDELDATPVVTILARRDGRTAVAAASCQVSLAGGMYQVADGVLSGLEPIELASSPNLSD